MPVRPPSSPSPVRRMGEGARRAGEGSLPMTAVSTTVSIGDGIIDAVELAPGNVENFPGGAALNLAVGLSRLGLATQLVTRFGLDRHGFLIERYLREEGVRIFNAPNVDFTGVAFSRRRNGEPTYEFTPEMYRRRI